MSSCAMKALKDLNSLFSSSAFTLSTRQVSFLRVSSGHVTQSVANLTSQVGSHTTLAAVEREGQCM